MLEGNIKHIGGPLPKSIWKGFAVVESAAGGKMGMTLLKRNLGIMSSSSQSCRYWPGGRDEDRASLPGHLQYIGATHNPPNMSRKTHKC